MLGFELAGIHQKQLLSLLNFGGKMHLSAKQQFISAYTAVAVIRVKKFHLPFKGVYFKWYWQTDLCKGSFKAAFRDLMNSV